MLDEFQKACPVILCKTAFCGAVDVQNAPNFSIRMNGDHDLRPGSTVAGDMAGKGVDIGDKLDGILLPGCAADAPAFFNTNAGSFSLKWS